MTLEEQGPNLSALTQKRNVSNGRPNWPFRSLYSWIWYLYKLLDKVWWECHCHQRMRCLHTWSVHDSLFQNLVDNVNDIFVPLLLVGLQPTWKFQVETESQCLICEIFSGTGQWIDSWQIGIVKQNKVGCRTFTKEDSPEPDANKSSWAIEVVAEQQSWPWNSRRQYVTRSQVF